MSSIGSPHTYISSAAYSRETSLEYAAHYFNPGYEASLLQMSPHYTPPRSVLQFRRDLSYLPLYLPHSLGRVAVSSATGWQLLDTTGIEPLLTPLEQQTTIHPWGWSGELIGLFPHLADRLSYTMPQMQRWGSRARSLDLAELLLSMAPHTFDPTWPLPHRLSFGESLECTVREVVATFSDQIVLKSEFSSSGRGVRFLSGTHAITEALSRLSLALHRTGHTFVEQYLGAGTDRGYEFVRTSEGTIHYIGGSMFRTEGGRYVGNYLLSPHLLDQRWSAEVTIPDHHTYIRCLTLALQQMDLAGYVGCLGVDTMVYTGRDGQRYIAPAVELNVRPTMGHIAGHLSDCYLPPDHTGSFEILHLRDAHAVHDLIASSVSDCPLYEWHHRPTQLGTYLLHPITAEHRFAAILRITT